jgi:hypothetical protein
LKSGTSQGKEISGMIRTLTMNCAPILDCSKDAEKTAAENASDEKIIGTLRALCELSLLVSPQNHMDPSRKALDDTMKPVYQKKAICRDQTMSKSAKAKLDILLATESPQLCEQKIHKIPAAMEALVYGAEKVSTTKCGNFRCARTKPGKRQRLGQMLIVRGQFSDWSAKSIR